MVQHGTANTAWEKWPPVCDKMLQDFNWKFWHIFCLCDIFYCHKENLRGNLRRSSMKCQQNSADTWRFSCVLFYCGFIISPWLTHWGRVTYINVSKVAIIGSDNGLSPRRQQAIFWTNAGILLCRPLETKFSEILIGIHTFSFKKMQLKVSYAKWRQLILGLNEFIPDSI